YEYFHGDDGSGIGASHQTGWTGTIATIMQVFGHISANDFKEGGVGEFAETVAKATKPDKESQ
ncbi:MAG: hypothetical protein QNL91_15670, partial [Candidatus Krumholzibacteria bacterium]|nr:hypothetical protein [Candidatus Krumholzibacteria bacterium]